MAQSISYKTVGNTGSLRTPSMNKPRREDPNKYFAMHAAIKAQREAKLMLAKKEKQAKDMWRDQQMAGITDTTFVEKVHGSIHEGAYAWLKEKQMRYGQLTDMLSAEGMNSKNPQWSEIQNERARIKNAYDSFNTNLEGFKAARQEAIDIAGPDIEDGGKKQNYNETATTPQSEKALGFLIDRQFGINGEEKGYGDMQINDDGSFVFAGTTWNGKEIGSKNLPKLTTMPYDKAQDILTAEKTFGGLIKNKTEDFNDEMFQQTVRSSIHKSFRDFNTGQLQAYLLNDMDGDGGTPAFIKHDEIVDGENPVLTWIDHSGKEQEMHYNDLMQSKDAMISFATHNEYEGTKTYLKSMIPKDDKNLVGTITGKAIEKLIRGNLVAEAPPNQLDEYGFPLPPDETTGRIEPGEEKWNVEKSKTSTAEALVRSKYNNSNIKRPPYSKMVTRNKAFEIFRDQYYDAADYDPTDPTPPNTTDPYSLEHSSGNMEEEARRAFETEYPTSEGNHLFSWNGEVITGSDVDPTNPQAVTEYMMVNEWLSEDKINILENVSTSQTGGSVLD